MPLHLVQLLLCASVVVLGVGYRIRRRVTWVSSICFRYARERGAVCASLIHRVGRLAGRGSRTERRSLIRPRGGPGTVCEDIRTSVSCVIGSDNKGRIPG